MLSRRTFLLLLIFAASDAAEAAADSVRVMSFNIRYATAPDGDNHWDKRKEFLVDVIKAFDPDLLGTQETLPVQRDYLAEKLAGYGVFAAGRDDGKDRGETTAVYWRQDRFRKLDGGHFWLSETPDKPGSKGWDAALPRIATWLKLQDRKAPDSVPIFFLNTHFDHRGNEARLESAKLFRDKIDRLGKGCSILVTGDFNAGEGSDPYRALFGKEDGKDGKDAPIADTFRVAHPMRQRNEGTFNAFIPTLTAGPRIDWIGASRDWTVKSAAIDRTTRDGRTPSDHFPVTTELER